MVTISPGPFLTPWRDSVAAIVDFGFPGEQEGSAVADILFGDTNPSGKLPHTLPNVVNEVKMTMRQVRLHSCGSRSTDVCSLHVSVSRQLRGDSETGNLCVPSASAGGVGSHVCTVCWG